MQQSSFRTLLADIQKLDCDVTEYEDNTVVVSLVDSDSSFLLLPDNSWLQIAATLIDKDEISQSPQLDKFSNFLLHLHSRYLGCRFAYDDDDSLVIRCDIYPENQNAEHVVQAIAQMQHVATATHSFFQRILMSGELPTDNEIDAAFSGSHAESE